MNKKIEKIINALETHEDMESIEILEELGTNSPALVRKNVHDSLKVVIINQGKGINDLSPVVAMSTVNEILSLEDKSEAIKILDDTINMNSIEEVRENAKSVKSLLELS